jgi:hypothetical protein
MTAEAELELVLEKFYQEGLKERQLALLSINKTVC